MNTGIAHTACCIDGCPVCTTELGDQQTTLYAERDLRRDPIQT